jgi:hypothetical protein
LSVSFEMIGLIMRKINSTIIWLCWPSGDCWVPVGDEFKSRLELKIIFMITLVLATTWLRSQMNKCLCRVQAPTLFILTFVFVSLVKFPVEPCFCRPRVQTPPLIGISVPTEGHGEAGARAVNKFGPFVACMTLLGGAAPC